MKVDGDCPPKLQLEDDVHNDEVDPNMYGEEAINFGSEEQHNTDTSFQGACPSPLPRIKSEPEGIILKREQTPIQALDDHNIPLVAEDEPNNSDTLLSHEDSSRPPKRRRLIPEVLLYTWKDLQRQRRKDFEKIKNMNNPIVQKPKNMELSLTSLYDRLKLAGLDPFKVTLEPEYRDQAVSRAFMSSVYGGCSHEAFPKISQAKYGEHGMKYFMYANAFRHTHAPQWPGNPGLFLRSEVNWVEGDIMTRVYKTFVRIEGGKWLYLGDYNLFDVPPLTKEEWKFLTSKVRNSWVNLIMKKNWGINFRAKVVARRDFGRKPTTDEWSRVIEEGRSNNVTLEEIHAALEAGHEQLGISGMKCVGYDEAFQRQAVERFNRWVPPIPKARRPRAQPGGNDLKLESDPESKPHIKQGSNTESKTPQRLRKRKREATPESDAELSPESEGSDVEPDDFLQDVGLKRGLRRTNVVKKREDEEFFGPFDDDDDDWKPETVTEVRFRKIAQSCL